MESQGRCWRPFRDRIKSPFIRWVGSFWLGVNAEGEEEEAGAIPEFTWVPGILPEANKLFQGGKEISNWRPCHHNDIKLIHEHLGDVIRLGRENRRQTVAQDQIWPAAYYCMAYKLKMDFMFLNFFLNQRKIVKIIKFKFQCT